MELRLGSIWDVRRVHWHSRRLLFAPGTSLSAEYVPRSHGQEVVAEARLSSSCAAWTVHPRKRQGITTGLSNGCLESPRNEVPGCRPRSSDSTRDPSRSPCRAATSCSPKATTAVTEAQTRSKDSDSATMAPLRSLCSGQWVKLICGASFEVRLGSVQVRPIILMLGSSSCFLLRLFGCGRCMLEPRSGVCKNQFKPWNCRTFFLLHSGLF